VLGTTADRGQDLLLGSCLVIMPSMSNCCANCLSSGTGTPCPRPYTLFPATTSRRVDPATSFLKSPELALMFLINLCLTYVYMLHYSMLGK
jgi:hypothetical protein